MGTKSDDQALVRLRTADRSVELRPAAHGPGVRVTIGSWACRLGHHKVRTDHRTHEATHANAQTLPDRYGQPVHHVMFSVVSTCERPGCEWHQTGVAKGTIS